MRIVSVVIRVSAFLLAAFRIFGLSLAGGADSLVWHLPAICLIGLMLISLQVVVRGGFLTILLVTAFIVTGIGAATHEVIGHGINEIRLAEIVTFVMFGAFFYVGTRKLKAT